MGAAEVQLQKVDCGKSIGESRLGKVDCGKSIVESRLWVKTKDEAEVKI